MNWAIPEDWSVRKWEQGWEERAEAAAHMRRVVGRREDSHLQRHDSAQDCNHHEVVHQPASYGSVHHSTSSLQHCRFVQVAV